MTGVFAHSALESVERRLRGLDAELGQKVLTMEVDEAIKWLRSTKWHLSFERDRLAAGGLAIRPKRKMPSLKRIAEVNNLGMDARCVRCGYTQGGAWPYTCNWLDRAHVIDRVFDGLDTEANLRPLCHLCHRSQPIFEPGDEHTALDWFAGLWYDSHDYVFPKLVTAGAR